MAQEPDSVDVLLEQWARERPDLDASPLAVVSRVLRLYKHLETAADEALAPFGLTLWQFDVLAALRRSGPPYALTPTQLMRAVTLSSGAMTNRIDRLEDAGYVVRVNDVNDRRVTFIHLTSSGRKLVDQALPARFQQARQALGPLSQTENETLARLLRKLVLHLAPADNAPEPRSALNPAPVRRTRP